MENFIFCAVLAKRNGKYFGNLENGLFWTIRMLGIGRIKYLRIYMNVIKHGPAA